MNQVLKNPILPGFYPDPSICRKGGDYYMVTSTFEYFPGVPVFHSRDLVHWRQIGHCLDRPDQLDLDGLNCSKGIYASTIRYHEKQDKFYMVTTLVKNPPYWTNVNFFVTAEDPAGPWSDPIVVKGAVGIDPTLFFDDDGKAYYLGNMRPHPDDPACMNRHMWLQEVDLETGELLGEKWILRTDGALYNAECPEGPHLYKIGGWYYLMIAEGGTNLNHCETIFRSKSICGPYEENPRNPLITHRSLRREQAINCPGHADLFQTQNGEWYAVLLGSRPVGDIFRGNLGRETFLVPVIWEEGWPVFSPNTGRVEQEFPAPDLPACPWPDEPSCDQFESEKLNGCWVTPRTPRRKNYSLTERPGWLRLYLSPISLKDVGNPAFLGRRQQHKCFSARTKMEFQPQTEQESAGLALLMSNDFHLRVEYMFLGGEPSLVLTRRFAGGDETVAAVPCRAQTVWLKVTAREQDYSFYFAEKAEAWQVLAEHVDGRLLSMEVAGGFTGALVGLYASSNGTGSGAHADFDWFEYHEIEP